MLPTGSQTWYTAKVPGYNSLKACIGTMFFLPQSFNKTLKTLEEVQHPSTALPEPELYIVVNGRPTKGEVVWRSLVNVDLVKTATKTLKNQLALQGCRCQNLLTWQSNG